MTSLDKMFQKTYSIAAALDSTGPDDTSVRVFSQTPVRTMPMEEGVHPDRATALEWIRAQYFNADAVANRELIPRGYFIKTTSGASK